MEVENDGVFLLERFIFYLMTTKWSLSTFKFQCSGSRFDFSFFLWRLAQSRRLIIVLLFSSQCRQRPLRVLLTQNSLWGMFISEGPDTALAILSPDFYGYSVLIMQTHSVIFALELFSPARWVLRVREREGPLWDTRDRRRVSSRIWMNPWGEWKWAWGCTFPSMNSSKQTSLN